MNKAKSIFLYLFSALLFVGCVEDIDVNIEFNATTYEMSVGDTLDFTAEVTVENTIKTPKFSSSDKSVAKFISDGRLVAFAPGEVELTAEVAGKSATAHLSVSAVPAEAILLESPDSLIAASEDWAKVVAKVEPGKYNYDNLVWEFAPSSEELGLEYKKVSASEYKLKVAAYVEGATVTVKASDKNSSVSQTATIKVSEPFIPEVAAKIVRLNAPDIITESEETWGAVTAEVVAEGSGEYNFANLLWEFTPSDAEATGFAYEKVDDSQYKVRFTAYKEGANVTVKVTDQVGGKFAAKTIAVEKKPQVGVTSIAVTPETLSLFVEETATLNVNCAPESYDASLLVWESSDEKVVTVNNGKVTAVGEGVAKVKVSDSVSKLYAECEVTVKVPVKEVVVKKIVLDVTSLNLRVGESSYQLKATCYDEAGEEVKDYAGLVWTAAQDVNSAGISYDVIDLTPQGIVTPKAAGRTIVTVAVESNRAVKATCEISVKEKEIKVEKLWLSPTENAIDINDTYTLKISTEPELSTVENKTITFVSSKPEVATVSADGVVTGVAYGEAEITATAASGVTATAKVTVKSFKVDVQEVVLDAAAELAMKIGDTKVIAATIKPSNSTVRTATWTSSDAKVVSLTVDQETGKATISAVAEGKAVVTAEADGKKAEVKVTVTKIEVESIALNAKSYTLDKNSEYQLKATVSPDNATDPTVTWSSSDETIVTVDATGLVKSHDKEGKAVITAKAGDKTATCEITVEVPIIDPTGIELSADKTTAQIGETVKLTAKLLPEGATGTVNWESSNPALAEVANGVVTVKKYEPNSEGKCVVTITALTGEVKATIDITVTPKPLTSVTINEGSAITLDKGQSKQLTYIYNEGAYPSDVKWTSADAKIATVDANGNVTAVAMGSTNVTLTVSDPLGNTKTATVAVTVNGIEPDAITLTPTTLKVLIGETYTGFSAVVGPDNTDWKEVKYSSSDGSVVDIDATTGKLTAKAVGSAEITVYSTRNTSLTATCAVTVEEKDFQITLSIDNEVAGKNVELPQFEKLNINASYTNGYVPSLSRWEVSDPTLVKVTGYDGYAVVEAIYDGMLAENETKSVTITHFAGTRSETKTIDVVRALPKMVEFVGLPKDNTLYLGEKFGPEFRAVVTPVQASQYVTYWGHVEIYSVANGSRAAYTPGTFLLTATAHDAHGELTSVNSSVDITVKAREVEGGTLSNTTLTLAEGEDATLEIDFMPAHNDNYDYNVVWESSNPSVATVEKGKVTAVAEGTATVIATLSNGDKLTCEVNVQKPAEKEVFVGDYYYSDGTWSTDLDPSKTVIGVVFSVENPTQMGDAQLAKDKPKATHGLVVALEETANVVWQAKASDVGQWLEDNKGYNDLKETGRKCGYANTLGLKAYNAACDADNKVLVAECAPNIALGAETSGWYLPSYAEWDMLFKYEQSTRDQLISNGAIAKKIEAAGGTPFSIIRYNYNNPDGAQDAPSYWASTESSGSSGWATCMHFLHGGQTNRMKHTKTYYIARYIFAF